MSFTVEATRSEMRQHVRLVAGLALEENRKAAFAFAAKVLGLSYQRVRAYFYDEVRQVPAHEADKIRAYVQAAEKLIEAREQYEAERRAFLAEAHPVVAGLAPGALGRKTNAACKEASEVVARRSHRGGRG